MTQELKEQLARDYADSTTPFGDHGGNNWRAAYNGYLAALNARDEEIERLNKKCNFAIERLRKAHEEIASFRNPWISVEERLQEEPLTICAVWLKGDDLVPHISLYDSGRFLLLPIDVTVTHWMPIPETPLNK